MFPLRQNGPSPAPSIEEVRRRAKHRLVGVLVLVLIAVVAFPLLFDAQPRTVSTDVPIVIPAKPTGQPLTVTAAAAPNAQPNAAVQPPATEPAKPPAVVASASRPSAAEPVEEVIDGEVRVHPPSSSRPVTDDRRDATTKPPKPADKPTDKPADKPVDKPADKPADRTAPNKPKPAESTSADKDKANKPKTDKPEKTDKTEKSDSEASRVRDLLDGRTPAADTKPANKPTGSAAATPEPAGARYIIQVGAFSEASAVQETRQKLEKSGLKTYTHAVETADGKRTRVRLGPFSKRSEAEQAAEKVKGLGLPAAILTL